MAAAIAAPIPAKAQTEESSFQLKKVREENERLKGICGGKYIV